MIATGSYVGTRTYGQSNPTVINCGFKPKIVFIFLNNETLNAEVVNALYGGVSVFWADGIEKLYGSNNEVVTYTATSNGLSFYSVVYWWNQNNETGKHYNYIALG